MAGPKKRNIVVFFHDPCLDGVASAWVFHKKWGDDPKVDLQFVPLSHGDMEQKTKTVLDNISPDTDVYCVDIGLEPEILNRLMVPVSVESEEDQTSRTARSITIIDHHESYAEDIAGYKPPHTESFDPPKLEFVLDEKAPAGATLTWKHIFEKESLPSILRWVGKIDSPSDLRNRDEFAVAAYIGSKDIRTVETAFAALEELNETSDEDMIHHGNQIQADQANNIKSLEEKVLYALLKLRLHGKKMWVPIINADVQNFGRMVSEDLVRIANLGTSPGVVLIWHVRGNGTVAMSVRTNGFPNAGRLTKFLGSTIGISGGGHDKDAAVHFGSLTQFVQAVPIFTKEEMLRRQWIETAEETSRPGTNGQPKERKPAHASHGSGPA